MQAVGRAKHNAKQIRGADAKRGKLEESVIPLTNHDRCGQSVERITMQSKYVQPTLSAGNRV